MRFNNQQYVQALYESIQDTNAKDHDKVINNFIEVLKKNGDLARYEAIIEEYEKYEKEQKGIKTVEVTTAGATINKNLISELNKLVGKNADIIHKQDDKIIGGVVIKIDDTLIDGSIKNHLDNLHNTLKGANNG